MKAVQFAAMQIMLGYRDVCVAGGMESMSNVPYLLEKARTGYGYGHQQVTDGILKDGYVHVNIYTYIYIQYIHIQYIHIHTHTYTIHIHYMHNTYLSIVPYILENAAMVMGISK